MYFIDIHKRMTVTRYVRYLMILRIRHRRGNIIYMGITLYEKRNEFNTGNKHTYRAIPQQETVDKQSSFLKAD